MNRSVEIFREPVLPHLFGTLCGTAVSTTYVGRDLTFILKRTLI